MTQSVYDAQIASARSVIAAAADGGYLRRSTTYSGTVLTNGRSLKLEITSPGAAPTHLIISSDKALTVVDRRAYIEPADDPAIKAAGEQLDIVRQWSGLANRIRQVSPETVQLLAEQMHQGHRAYLVKDVKASVALGMMDVEYLIIPALDYAVVRTQYKLPGTDIVELQYEAEQIEPLGDGLWRPRVYRYTVYGDDEGHRHALRVTELRVIGEVKVNQSLPDDFFAPIPPPGIRRLVDRTGGRNFEFDFEEDILLKGGLDKILASGLLPRGRPTDTTPTSRTAGSAATLASSGDPAIPLANRLLLWIAGAGLILLAVSYLVRWRRQRGGA